MSLKFAICVIAITAVRAGYIGAPIAAPFSYSTNLGVATPAIARIASPVAYSSPLAKIAVANDLVGDFDAHPQYSFGYDIQDGLTGDNKNHEESRDGDVVRGSYSLNDADGTRRIVEYVADPIHGFNAIVRKEPLIAKVTVAAPIAKVHAPLAL